MSVTRENLVRLGASFDGPWLVYTNTVRELAEGEKSEHDAEDVFAWGGATGGGQGFALGSQSFNH